MPPALLAELIRTGVTVRHVVSQGLEAERHHIPSAKPAEFVRMRDLTCRFPGCYCRKHHLLKTWWTGGDGWSDEQRPDGTIIVTSPTGKNYTTKPGSSLLFPDWNIITAPSPPNRTPPARAPVPS